MKSTRQVNRLLLPLLLCASISVAAAAEAPSLIARVKARYNEQTSIEAQFTLKTYWSVQEKETTTQGRFWLAPGDKFKVTMGKRTYVSDGTTYWEYNQATGQLLIKKLSQIDLSTHPSRLLTSFINDHVFRQTASKGGLAMLAWNADSLTTAQFTSIVLGVDPTNATIKTITTQDRNGNSSTYTFKKTVTGEAIPGEVFTFETPKGARVVDLRD